MKYIAIFLFLTLWFVTLFFGGLFLIAEICLPVLRKVLPFLSAAGQWLGLFSLSRSFVFSSATPVRRTIPQNGVVFSSKLSVVKDFLDVVVKMSAMLSVGVGACLFVYLKNIGWAGAFLDSVGSGAGLIAVVVLATLLALSINFLFVLPSVFLVFVVSAYPADRRIPDYVPRVLRGSFIWCWGFVIVSGFMGVKSPCVFAIFIILMACYVLIFHSRALLGVNWSAAQNPVEKTISSRLWESVVLGGGGAVVGLSALIPASMALGAALRIPGIKDYSQWWGYFGMAVVALVSAFPGIIYMRARCAVVVTARSIGLASIAALGVIYLVMVVVVLVTPVSTVLFTALGIFSEEKKSFFVSQDAVIGAFVSSGFSVQKNKYQLDEKFVGRIFDGYVRYSFGGVRIICKGGLGVEEGQGGGNGSRGLMGFYSKGEGCLTVQSSEVREIRSADWRP